jgi:dUTP pyrophosphatase
MPKEYVLKIKPLTPEIKKLYENQKLTHKGDAGVDIYNSNEIINVNYSHNKNIEQFKIDFKIQCEVVKNYLTPNTFLRPERMKKYSQKTGDNEDTLRDENKSIEKSVNISYLLVPRSSIVKTPFRMSNSIGIIDAGYRGNLMAYVDRLNNSDILRENERLFQIVLPNLKPIDRIEIVDELSSSSRGTGGFGSTGLK